MTDPISDKARLEHIIQSILKIEEYIGNMSYEEFFKSDIHKSAVNNELQIIGEAVTRLSNSLKNRYPEVEWKGIKNLRNIVVHEYFAIDYSVIWELIKFNTPALKIEVRNILDKIENKN